MTRRLPAAAAAALIFAASCSGGGKAAGERAASAQPEVPVRAPTYGDALLGLVPMGAEIILEIDLVRIRSNEVAGPLLGRLERAGAAAHANVLAGVAAVPAAFLGIGIEVLGRIDVVVMASYRVGTGDAASLVFVRGEGLRDFEVEGGRRLDERTYVLGPDDLLARVDQVRRGEAAAVKTDRHLLATRAAAMPEKAKGASLRLSARLAFDARVELASRFGLDVVPAWLSVWGDVADDLAVVALLGGEDDAEAKKLTRAVERWRATAARSPWVSGLRLGYLVELVEVSAVGGIARVVFIVGPARLERLVRTLAAGLARPDEL